MNIVPMDGAGYAGWGGNSKYRRLLSQHCYYMGDQLGVVYFPPFKQTWQCNR